MTNEKDCLMMIELLKLSKQTVIDSMEGTNKNKRTVMESLLRPEQQDIIVAKLFKNLDLK